MICVDAQLVQLGHDVLLAVLDVVLPAVIAWGFSIYKKHVTTSQEFEKQKDMAKQIEQIVKLGVIVAEKAGAVDSLTGSEQFAKAKSFVQTALQNAHITDVDLKKLEAMIEKEWADNKYQLEDIYHQPKKEE